MTLGQKDTAILTKLGQYVILWQTVQMFRLECPDFWVECVLGSWSKNVTADGSFGLKCNVVVSCMDGSKHHLFVEFFSYGNTYSANFFPF
jgi:hypothetical protein